MIKQSGYFVLLAFLAIGIASCGKRKKAKVSAQDNEIAESMFNDVFNQASNQTRNEENQQFKTGYFKTGELASVVDTACVKTVTTFNSDSTYFRKVVIDYGSGGCTVNGRTRKGKIIVELDTFFFVKGSQITITTGDNFYIDDHKVEGKKVVTNDGFRNLNNGIAWDFTVEVTNGKVTTPNNETITWESSRTHTWKILTGNNSGIYLEVDGSASGKNRNDANYTIDITKTLIAKAGCAHIIEGELTINADNLNKEAVVDYGDGTCDNKATLTYGNQKEKEFALK